ncbi:MAG: hypothetical protein K2I83_04145, partial [Bacteroidales bacterium]|nr:hypothetical protein [Bacteroidales bacterium]
GGVAQRDAYQNVGTDANYEFAPGADAVGMNYIRFSAGNHCGWDTAYDSVMVILNPVPGPVTGIPTEPGKGPDDPIENEVEGPKSENITVEICEGNTLYLAATYTGGPAESSQWQVDSADIKPMSSPYSLRNDTLVINPVPASINGKVFRCVFKMPGNVPAVNSYNITVHVNNKPNVANTWVSIMDEDANPKLDTGQALPGHKVVLTAENVPEGATKICFYQAFKDEEGKVDSVKLLACGEEDTYTLTEEATVAEHDATWYYVQVYNDCGYDSTRPYQLRIFDTLNIRWIPDTLIENPSGGWDYTLHEPEPGKVVVLLRPGEDSVQAAAHLWVCQDEEFWVRDTTKSGFMNRENTDPSIRASRWFFRKTEDADWELVDESDAPWRFLYPVTEVLEH